MLARALGVSLRMPRVVFLCYLLVFEGLALLAYGRVAFVRVDCHDLSDIL